MTRRGVTLAELLVALACTAFLAAAMLNAYSNAIKVPQRIQSSEAKLQEELAFKDTVTQLLHHVYLLNNGATNTTTTTTTGATGTATTALALAPRTYFTTNPQVGNTGLSQSSGGQAQGGGGGSTSELVFTTLGEPTNQAALNDPSDDFIQQNQIRGPQGGVVEYQIGLTPVGTPPPDETGIFIRRQQPADNDPTQGGVERLLLPGIDNLLFEFWDGLEWQQSWDTTTQGTIRLPAAVRVTYSIGNDNPKVFVVQLPLSDATPENPVTDIGGGMTG